MDTQIVDDSTIDNNSDKPIEMPPFIEVYTYNPYGYYIGVYQADKSPVDDTYLKPEDSTEEKPPITEEGKIPKWNKDKKEWDIVDIPKSSKDDSINDADKTIILNLQQQVSELQDKLNEVQSKSDSFQQIINEIVLTNLKNG